MKMTEEASQLAADLCFFIASKLPTPEDRFVALGINLSAAISMMGSKEERRKYFNLFIEKTEEMLNEKI